ncbi:hypothetical protein E7U29_23500 [Salmonella enterica]|nr:hypothetical protein [Salmonella enterica]EEG6053386.1 hypothetical protein [Salmonella enterica subsp. enterica]EFB0088151.1 hypothetical protein [Salmonella enterica]EFR3658144.1 hypothetical protein [Salmonella enterica]EIE7706004.1 hypothetical protein [Salmonella enterica]
MSNPSTARNKFQAVSRLTLKGIDLYLPQVKNVVILFDLLEKLEKQFKGKIHFGMPELAANRKE